jgi:hypothetical protein
VSDKVIIQKAGVYDFVNAIIEAVGQGYSVTGKTNEDISRRVGNLYVTTLYKGAANAVEAQKAEQALQTKAPDKKESKKSPKDLTDSNKSVD